MRVHCDVHACKCNIAHSEMQQQAAEGQAAKRQAAEGQAAEGQAAVPEGVLVDLQGKIHCSPVIVP